MAKITIQSVYEEYKNDVYTYLMSLTRNKPLSEDLTSEVFVGAIKALPTYRGDASIKTWLFSIARYKWYEHLRKSKRQVLNEDLVQEYLTSGDVVEATVVTKQLVDRIYEILDSEPERNKNIVLMRIDGYSYFEIAEKHKISESSARVVDFRTKAKIRANLLKEGYSDEQD